VIQNFLNEYKVKMSITISSTLLQEIHSHGERAYPEEGAGLLLGTARDQGKVVTEILTLENARELSARHNRYLLTAEDYMHGENEAARRGLDVLGVFHSHPDHPNRPSEFDREWAMPWFSYIITSVHAGQAKASCSWRLVDDRSQFVEETLSVADPI
jgi:proteasome lid subunit RPN8/RPN11